MNIPAIHRTASRQSRRLIPVRGFVISCAVLIATQLVAAPVTAAPASESTIAVLDFELYDLTLAPESAAEKERTAAIGPLLRQNLKSQYGFELVTIESDTQDVADKGTGYLFEHHDVAAQLGREASSDWVVVGRVHKASFLFVYFKALVIDTKTERPIADLVVEVKGTEKRLTEKGVESLAAQIAAAINEA